jgi:hypothetical protein
MPRTATVWNTEIRQNRLIRCTECDHENASRPNSMHVVFIAGGPAVLRENAQVFQIRGVTAGRPQQAGRRIFHSSANHSRAASLLSPR